MLKTSKQIYKESYPLIKQLQRESAACAKIYNVAKEQDQRQQILEAFKVKETEFQKKLGVKILEICENDKIDILEYHESVKIWAKKNPEVVEYDRRINEMIQVAVKGQFLDSISDKIDYLMKAGEIREIYSNASDFYCNQLLEKVENFIKEKEEKEENFQAGDVSSMLKEESKGIFNIALQKEIEMADCVQNRPEHCNHLFDVSLLKSVQGNDEGIAYFLEQCDFVRELVMNSLTQFKPDFTM